MRIIAGVIFLWATQLTSAVDSDICFAGQFPGPATCEPCLGADIQGSMCVRHTETGSHWMPCHKSVEECCKNDPEVTELTPSIRYCVDNSAEYTIGNTRYATEIHVETTTSTSEGIISTTKHISKITLEPTLTPTPNIAETGSLLFSEVGLCISPQYPPLTCGQCPEAEVKLGMCAQHGSENCYESVEECCTDLNIIDYGYGYEYCVNKSGESTSTSVSYGGPYNVEIPGANDSLCIAPHFPAPGICEQCPRLAILSGYLCAWPVGEDWPRLAECYESVEECCKVFDVLGNRMVDYCASRSPSIAPSAREDIPSSKLYTANTRDGTPIFNSVATPEHNEMMMPRVKYQYCSTVASLSNDSNNDYCMRLCDDLMANGKKPIHDEGFTENCAQQHWHEFNGHAVVDGDCYDKWVYGYSEWSDLVSYVNDLVTDTPAQCQLHCQRDADCVNWLWVADIYAASAVDVVHRCSLKNLAMVQVPLQIVTEVEHPENMDVKYCDNVVPHLCMAEDYDCLRCDSEKRCVWRSNVHVSGWKYCGVSKQCSAPVFESLVSTIPGEKWTARTGTSKTPEIVKRSAETSASQHGIASTWSAETPKYESREIPEYMNAGTETTRTTQTPEYPPWTTETAEYPNHEENTIPGSKVLDYAAATTEPSEYDKTGKYIAESTKVSKYGIGTTSIPDYGATEIPGNTAASTPGEITTAAIESATSITTAEIETTGTESTATTTTETSE